MDRAPKKARVDGQVLMEGSTGDATTSFSPDDRTMALFESTGITGVSVVRSRVERARSALMATFPYKCVQEYRVASARSLLHPEYSTLLARHRARLGTIPNSDIATTPTTYFPLSLLHPTPHHTTLRHPARCRFPECHRRHSVLAFLPCLADSCINNNAFFKASLLFLLRRRCRAMCRKVLDLGCCMGTDLRQFVLDGWCTAGDGVGLDSQQPFIDAGHDMFGDHVRELLETRLHLSAPLSDGRPSPPSVAVKT